MGYTPIKFTAGNEKVLETISTNTIIELDKKRGINLQRPDVAYTISVVFLQEIAEYLKLHSDSIIDLHDIIRFGTENRESDDAEKEGNITPWVELPMFLEPNLDELPLTKYTKGNEKEIEAIAKATLIHLKKANELNIVKESVAFITTVSFIKEISDFLRENPDEQVEIGSLIKFRTITKKTDEDNSDIIPIAELGELFKLGVKNDDDTEDDEDEDNDE